MPTVRKWSLQFWVNFPSQQQLCSTHKKINVRASRLITSRVDFCPEQCAFNNSVFSTGWGVGGCMSTGVQKMHAQHNATCWQAHFSLSWQELGVAGASVCLPVVARDLCFGFKIANVCVCVREGGATASFNTRCSNEMGVKGGADKAMGRERVRATRWQVYQRKHFTAGMGSQVKCQHLSRRRRHPFTRQWVRAAPGKPGIGPRRSARRLTSLFSLLFFPPKHARVSCSVCFFH